MRTWFALAAVLASLAVDARTKASPKKTDPRTVGLGRSCKKRADCKGRSQICLKESDARGKVLPHGFCALPCSPLDMRPAKAPPPGRPGRGADGGVAGGRSAQERPATPAEIKEAAKRKPASRCPPRYACRSAGAGVPIDLCVKE